MSTGAPSRSALDMLNWMEDDYEDDDERSFWRYLCKSAECYPQAYIPPLHKQSGRPRVHQLIGGRIDHRNGPDGQAVPTRLWLYGPGDCDGSTDLSGESTADAFAGALLTARYRSCFVVFREGGRVELRLIATQLAGRLIELGFTIDVLMGGSRLKALIIKRGKHRWYLCCWEALTGRPSNEISLYAKLSTSEPMSMANPATTVWRAANAVQEWLRCTFGTGLSLTISNTALRAAARSLPSETCKFKPLPLMVSLCRNGGAFRGGLQRGTRYRGPTWLIDLNRAYTAALEKPLPWRYIFDKCEKDGTEREGIYVCRVVGRPGLAPIYVGSWTGSEVEIGWRSYPESAVFWCSLPTSEISGLRSIGYTVTPRWGFVFTRTLSLAAFVSTIRKIVQRFGPSSPVGKLTKLIGNSVFGKLAAPPERRDLRIAQEKPGKEWNVFVGEDGWPIADLWERMKCVYQWSQHVDIASEITARVRGVMYATQANIEANGGRVVGMQTDSIVLTCNPADVCDLDGERIGSWRVADADTDGIVAGSNCWAIGQKTVCPDNPHPLREDILALYHEYPIEIRAQKSGAPRPGAPLSIAVIRRITPPRRASPSAAAD